MQTFLNLRKLANCYTNQNFRKEINNDNDITNCSRGKSNWDCVDNRVCYLQSRCDGRFSTSFMEMRELQAL